MYQSLLSNGHRMREIRTEMKVVVVAVAQEEESANDVDESCHSLLAVVYWYRAQQARNWRRRTSR